MVDGMRAARADAARDDEIFRGKLSDLAAQEARDAKARRARARDNQLAHLAQMADKKRTQVAWSAVDASDARAADSAALGGPLDAVFNEEAAALRADVAASGDARGVMEVDRLVHRLKNPKPFL